MTPTDSPPTPTTPITPLPAPPGRYYRPTETEALGDAIAELSARIQAATYELLVMIHHFDERGGWAPGGTTCAHWLNWRTGLALGAAPSPTRRCGPSPA